MKASFAGSNGRTGGSRKLIALAGLVLVVSMALGVSLAAATAPTVAIDPTPTVTTTTAQVSGTVNPEDTETYFYFQYSADPAAVGWTNAAFQGPLAAGSGTQGVSDEITGLTPGTTYSFRLVATNFADAEVFSAEPNPSFTTEPIFPPELTLQPVDPGTVGVTTAEFKGSVDPSGKATEYHFEYSSNGGASWKSTASESAGSGDDPADVSAELSDLRPNSSYEVRLTAQNSDGMRSTDPAGFHTDQSAPLVQTLTASQVTGSSAWIRASINPAGDPTAFHFEYGPDTGYGASVPAGHDRSAGHGTAPLTVSESLSGLQPNTTYHYRVVASNAVGANRGEDQIFTTEGAQAACANSALREAQTSQGLPDCRAYEQVSPVDKNHSDITAHTTLTVSSLDGQAVTFGSKGAFGDVQGTSTTTEYLARRGDDSWQTTGISPPTNPEATSLFHIRFFGPFSPDLSHMLLRNQARPALTADAQTDVTTPYVRNNLTGTYTNVAPSADPLPASPFTASAVFAGASDDLSHVLLQSRNPLVAGGPASGLYAYEYANDELRVASIVDGLAVEANAGTRTDAATNQLNPEPGPRSVSRDGRVLAFVTTADHQVYLRRDGQETIHVSASQRTDCADHDPCTGAPESDPLGAQPAAFVTMSGDGSAVLFKSTERLTNDSLLPGHDEARSNMYLYDVVTGGLTNLTANSPTPPQAADYFAISENGDTVYFTAENKLTPDAAEGGLYVWRSGTLSYIGAPNESPGAAIRGGGFRTAVATPDGGHLVFGSSVPLLGEDFNPVDPDRQCTARSLCLQIYLYSLETDELTCVSCGWPGQPVGDAGISISTYGASEIPDTVVKPISSDGNRVFFHTPQSLVPRDVNGRYDVYEWERVGTGSCSVGSRYFSTARSGCVFLISSGLGDGDSYFLDADSTGRNVFFTTSDRLAGSDRDGSIDLYDARVDGGLASQLAPEGKPPCISDGCQGQAVVPPDPSRAASSSFSGPGNPPVRRSKARAKRHGAKHRKHGKHKRHARKSHSKSGKRGGK